VVITRETSSFLLEHNSKEPDVPWFVCASYTRPHSPYTSPGRYFNKYKNKVPVPKAPTHYRDSLEPYARQNLDIFNNEEITQEQTQRAVEGYYACVDFVDDCIGELLDCLEKQGLLENTIVIYTSDHGDMIGQHGLWGKAVYYEDAISAPLLIRTPGENKHKKIKEPVSLMDIFPTCCDLAGLPIPKKLDGISFADILNDPDNLRHPREYVTSAYYKYAIKVRHLKTKYSEGQPCQAMRLCRQKDWKYVEIEGGEPLLFDMANDPQENINLATKPDYKDKCLEMREQIFAELTWDQVHEIALSRQKVLLSLTEASNFHLGQAPIHCGLRYLRYKYSHLNHNQHQTALLKNHICQCFGSVRYNCLRNRIFLCIFL